MTDAPPSSARMVAVGVCTFRRPGLARTLESLAALRPDERPMQVLVADNDDDPSARPLVLSMVDDFPCPLLYLHAPARNISIARNALLDAAVADGARFLAFVDDDEVAEPDWLARLLARQQATGAAAVMGHIAAEYPADAPAWMRRAAVHDTMPVTARNGAVIGGYTGNVLMDLAHPAIAGRRFDLARGVSGGEDTAFFAGVLAAGGGLAYAPDARVREAVAPSRATLRWLLVRRFRMGQTHGSLLRHGASRGRRAGQIGLAGAKAAACLGMALAGALDPVRRNRQLMRATLHMGAVASLLGVADLELYGAAETPGANREEG